MNRLDNTAGRGGHEASFDNDPRRTLAYWERIHASLTRDIKYLNSIKRRSPIEEKELKMKRQQRRNAAYEILGFQQRLMGF